MAFKIKFRPAFGLSKCKFLPYGKNNPSFIAKFGIGHIVKSTSLYLRSDFRKMISPWLGLEPTKVIVLQNARFWVEKSRIGRK